jgi:peptide-methionine (R)-S-oxide reductase
MSKIELNYWGDSDMKKTDQEYKQMLGDIEYRVTREAATERPFTGKYWDHWGDGKYTCV